VRVNVLLKEANITRKELSEMEEKQFVNAQDVQKILGVSRAKSYQSVHALNDELKDMGYMTITGRVSYQFFQEKFYGLKQA
jgi:hypothetical protein